MGSIISDVETNILENMFVGGKNRDASSSIRGFLFQDLVSIEYLLDDEVESVCSEYLEDIDVFYKNGLIKILQVKYYPCTRPDMISIMSDLYYQYLRLDLYKSKLRCKPLLIIHREDNVKKIGLEKMKSIINPKSLDKPKLESNFNSWLIDNVYILNKEQQYKKLFSNYAYTKSIESFIGDFDVIKKGSIVEFQDYLEKKLIDAFPSVKTHFGENNGKKILIGLAISIVQRRYKVDKPQLDVIRINRGDFCSELNNCVKITSNEHIVAYLKSVVLEVMGEIIKYNKNLSETQMMILNNIYRHTIEWISDIGSDISGQAQLVNTLGDVTFSEIQDFSTISDLNRLEKICECKRAIKQFLKYLWKIILDLCMDKTNFDIHNDDELTNPKTYVVSSETRYICFNFPRDYVATSVFVTENPESPKASRKNICFRLMEAKPKKWFMKGNAVGKFDYDYSTAEIRQGNSVTEMDDDSFIIECMNCIKVDCDDWAINDNCDKCIFSEKCCRGGE